MLTELYKIYRDSNILLARSIVLKSEATLESLLEYFEMIGIPEGPNPRTWKYYLNLSGEYHYTDEVMTVLSSDTQEPIEFRKEILVNHPLTRTEYSRNGKHRALILNKYPKYENLIDRIIDPVDIEEAINAEDLTILGYDGKLVASNEVNLIPELQKWIKKFGIRWNVTSMAVTDKLYPAVFIGNLYLAMVNEISNIRISNMKTPMASEWHVWTYLSGHLGLDDYKEYLTTDQALWLYRNIEYIRRNAGKESVMESLMDNLLLNRGLSVTKFDMIKSEDTLKDFREINVRVNKSDILEDNSVIDVGSLLEPTAAFELTKIRALNNTSNIDIDSETFNKHSLGNLSNTRKLNVVEVSQKLNVLSRFANDAQLKTDYWVYLSTIGLYKGSLSIPVPGKTALNLSPLEALILMIHTANKAFGWEVTHIPNINVRSVIPPNYPSRSVIANLLDDEYVKKDEVLNVLFKDLVGLKPVDSLAALSLFIDDVTDQDFRHYFAQDLARREEGKSMIRVGSLALLRNHECILSPEGLTFQTWLDQLEIDLTNLTQEDFLEIAINCLEAAAGVDKSNNGLPSGQKAVVELFDRLTSYGLITMEGRSYNANSTINWHFSGYNKSNTQQDHTFPVSLGGPKLSDLETYSFEFEFSDVIEKTSIRFTDKGNYDATGSIEIGLKPTMDISQTQKTFVSNHAPIISNIRITHTTD